MVEFIESIKKEPKSFKVEILASCIGCLQGECDNELRRYARDFLDAEYDDKYEPLERMMYFSAMKLILDDFDVYLDILYRSTMPYVLDEVREYVEREKKYREKQIRKKLEELPFE